MSPDALAEAIKDRALALGFDLVGICRAAPTPRDAEAFRIWTEAEMQGTMEHERVWGRATKPFGTGSTARGSITTRRG